MIKVLFRSIIYLVLVTFISSIIRLEFFIPLLYAKPFTSIAMIDLSSDQISEENKKRIHDLLQNKLYGSESVSIVPEKSIETYIKKFHEKDDASREAAIQDASLLFSDGKVLYENTNYQEAEIKFGGCLEKLLANIEALEDNELVINCSLYKALNYTGQGEDIRAITTVKDLFKLDTNSKVPRTITEHPKFTKLLEASRKEMEIFSSVALDIESSQNDVAIYLNGKFVGETKDYKKLRVPKVYSGKHRIVAKKAGYKRSTLEFVAHNEDITMKINLVPNDFRQLLADTNSTSKSSMFEFLRKFGQDPGVGAHIILLTSIAEERGNFELRAQLYDVRKDIYTSSFKVSLGENLKFPGEGIDKIYDTIAMHMQDGYVIKELSLAKKDEAIRERFKEGVESEEDLFKKFPKRASRADSIRAEVEDVDLGRKKAVAATVLILLLAGAGVGGYFWYKSLNREAEVVIVPPDSQNTGSSLLFHW